jgi:hypothetical protein
MRQVMAISLLLLSTAVHAQTGIQKSGPESFPGKNELSAHVGYQAGFAGQFANPSGFKLFMEYGRRFTDLVWLNIQLNPIFGFGAPSGICYDNFGNGVSCAGGPYYGGWGIEAAAGIKLKIKTNIPLVVEVPLTVGVVGMVNRTCGDNGAAVAFRPGVSVKYFLKRNIAIGGGANFAFGPGFHEASVCSAGYTDFYGAFDFQLGAEFIL